MGSIKSKNIKNISNELVKRFPQKFSGNYIKNKEVIREITLVNEKKAINQIAGHVTRVAGKKARRTVVS
jgi:small subunit ribosomal protein S17e